MATHPSARQMPGDHVPDTLLGVCAGISEATGVPAMVMRIAFVLAILSVSIQWAVGTYLVLAVAFAIARMSGKRAEAVVQGR